MKLGSIVQNELSKKVVDYKYKGLSVGILGLVEEASTGWEETVLMT